MSTEKQKQELPAIEANSFLALSLTFLRNGGGACLEGVGAETAIAKRRQRETRVRGCILEGDQLMKYDFNGGGAHEISFTSKVKASAHSEDLEKKKIIQ